MSDVTGTEALALGPPHAANAANGRQLSGVPVITSAVGVAAPKHDGRKISVSQLNS